MSAIRLLIVDDHPVVREGLRIVFSLCKDFDVVGAAENGPAAVEAFERLRPDVTLTDLWMPDMDGLELAAALRKLEPAAKVIILTSFETRADVDRALASQVDGFLLKASPTEEILDSVRRVHSGLTALSTHLMRNSRNQKDLPRLTSREVEVLERVVHGYRNQQIAQELEISLSTVKFHLNRILEKLGAQDRTEAAIMAVRDGFIRL